MFPVWSYSVRFNFNQIGNSRSQTTCVMGKVLKVIEVLSESSNSYEDAIKNAVEETSKSVRNIRSAYVNEQSVTVKDGKVDKFRVNVKLTFEVDI